VSLYDVSGTAAGAGDATVTPSRIAAAIGPATGSGSLSAGSGIGLHWATANVEGTASLSAISIREMIFGGYATGAGTLYDTLTTLAAGTTLGQGTLATEYVRLVSVSGYTFGRGSLAFSEPMPMVGIGNIVAFAEVLHVPPPLCGPVCCCDNCCGRREERCDECFEWHRRFHHREAWWWQCRECWRRHSFHHRECKERHHHEWSQEPNPQGLIGQFRWNQTLGKGDLEICLLDRWGNQRGPVFIGYTMFMVSSTGILHQVGPTDRKPAKADVGKFYVTGTAGENGQPGCWAVRWRYQKTYSEPIVERLVQFRVVDAVLDCARPDPVPRHCKYGWDL